MGVGASAPSDGVYAELGRFPLSVYRKVSVIKYLKRLENLSDERLARKAFQQLSHDNDEGHHNWISQACGILEEFNVSSNDSDYSIKHMVKNAYKAKLKPNLDNCIGQRKKLRTYAEFKETVNFEKYLEIITNFAIRKSLTRNRAWTLST